MTAGIGSLGELVEFLRARIDEDEAMARAAVTEDADATWEQVDPEELPGMIQGAGGGLVTYDDGYPSGAQARHIAHQDPRRVLRGSKAKRAIVDWCVEVIGDRDLDGYAQSGILADDKNALAVTLAVETLRNLATIDPEHADFREEWTP